MKAKQRVIVLTGAAGSGKTTIQKYLEKKYAIPAIVTHTTRPARVGEQPGVDYYFEDEVSFAKLHLLENVQYAGNQYGSSVEGLNRALENHQFASIVLDTAGALTYQKEFGDQALVLFLTVQDPTALQQRMLQRGDQLNEVKNRIQSREVKRDFRLPKELNGKAIVIENEDWTVTKQKIDQIIKKLRID